MSWTIVERSGMMHLPRPSAPVRARTRATEPQTETVTLYGTGLSELHALRESHRTCDGLPAESGSSISRGWTSPHRPPGCIAEGGRAQEGRTGGTPSDLCSFQI